MRKKGYDTFYGMCLGGHLDGKFKQWHEPYFRVPVLKPLEKLTANAAQVYAPIDVRTETYHYRPLLMSEGETFAIWTSTPSMTDRDILQAFIDGYRRPHVEES